MAVDYSKLVPGQRVSDRTYVLDDGAVSRYADAVGDRSDGCFDEDGAPLAPPMAVAALSLRGVINDLEIPGGTLHARQELGFIETVSVGETLDCRATLVRNSIRRGWRFLVVQLEVVDAKGQRVMNGKSTITLPAHG